MLWADNAVFVDGGEAHTLESNDLTDDHTFYHTFAKLLLNTDRWADRDMGAGGDHTNTHTLTMTFILVSKAVLVLMKQPHSD